MLAYIASWFYNLALLVAGLVVIVLALLYLMQDKIIYQPDPFGNMKQNYKNPEGYRHPGERNIPYEEIQITTADNVSISTWLLKRPEASAPTLIYFHGNAGNIGIRLDVFEELYFKCKVNILAVDYRGYGCSEGIPSEQGLMLDADAVLKHALNSQSLNKSAIFIYGASIGGAVAIYAAQKFKEVRGVILENTFTCLGEVVDSVMPFLSKFRRLVLRNYWPTVDRIKHVDCSILFIAGVKDEIVPHAHMLRLYDLAKSGKKDILLVQNGDHNFVWRTAGPAFAEKISNFVKTV